MPGESDCSLEAQTAAWRRRLQPGGECRLEARIAAWGVSRVALWNPRVPFGTPQVAMQLQVAIWSFRMSFEGRGVHLKLQVGIWSSRWPFGAPAGI